ncbi:general secretion pathway protein GspB [Ideonella dechloratans]
MSYILDALRRADAERERERQPVPGLHSQGGSPAPTAVPPAAAPWWPWALGALLMVGSGLGAAWWWTRAGTPSATLAVPPLPTPVAAPAPGPTLTPTPTPAPAPTTPAATVGPTPTPPAPHTPPSVPAPAPVLAAPAQPRAIPLPAPAPAPAAAPIQEASPALKREMARLGVSGSVYSDDPASRFVIVRGEVVHEGATLAPELVLEQIRPHELVLRYKGQRMRQPL